MSLCDQEGLSPLNVALLNGHESTAQLLQNDDADVNIFHNNRTTILYER